MNNEYGRDHLFTCNMALHTWQGLRNYKKHELQTHNKNLSSKTNYWHKMYIGPKTLTRVQVIDRELSF